MSSDTLSKSLNKGVPCSEPVYLATNDLIKMSRAPEYANKKIKKAFDRYVQNLVRIINNNADIDLLTTLCVTVDEETLEKKITFSIGTLIGSIASYVGLINPNSTNGKVIVLEDESTEAMLEKLQVKLDELKKVKSDKILRKNYPILFIKRKQLIDALNEYQNLKRTYKKNFKDDLSFRKFIFSRNPSYLGIIDECEKIADTSDFIKKYTDVLQGLIDHFDEIKKYLEENPLNLGNMEINENKLDLYIAYQHINMAKQAPKEKKQEFLYYVSNYFMMHSQDEKTSIIVGQVKNEQFNVNTPGEVITPAILFEEYKKIMASNPELRMVDFSLSDFKDMNLREVKEFMNIYFEDLKANWDFLRPDDKDEDRLFIKDIDTYVKKKSMTEEEKEQLKQKLLSMYIDKKEFFDVSEPVYRIKGKNTFSGYIGYIYKNGKVVFEKFFENSNTNRLASNEAIYIMDIDDFHKLSRLSKTEIIANKLCKRFIHRGDWRAKVLQEINTESDISLASEMLKLKYSGAIEESGSNE